MKKFFKPTLAKFIIALLLPFYFGITGHFAVSASGELSIVNQVVVSASPFVLLVFGTMYLWVSGQRAFTEIALLSVGQRLWYFFLEIFLALIINYLLACAVVYSYHWLRQYLKKREKLPIK